MVIHGTEEGNATFLCTALGGPGNVVIWKKSTSTDQVIANSSKLSILDLSVLDGGYYQCLVKNQAGEDRDIVTLNSRLLTVIT